MESELYMVLIDGVSVGQNLSIEHAMIFIEALFSRYYNDINMTIQIKRMDCLES